MFKRMVVPAMAIAAMLAVLLVVLPVGAIGSNRSVSSNHSHDVYTFGHNVVISAPVEGSVQAYGGSIDVRNVVDGDVLVFGGNVNFSGSGRVRGNVIYGGGRVVDGAGRIDGQIYPLASIEGAAGARARAAVILTLMVLQPVGTVIVTLTNGREVRLSSLEMRASSLHCFVLGLVAFTSFVLTAIMFSYLVPYLIGIPLLAVLAVFAILTKIYGMVTVFHFLGTLVAGARTRDDLALRKWLRGDVAMVVVGVLVLGAVRLIPVVGTIVWSAASIFGIGVALATKFGRREPWFLAWRTAEA
ncbi:MAG: hypothetical protein NVSMB68_10660 [Thermoanaerobaculia bacterium]